MMILTFVQFYLDKYLPQIIFLFGIFLLIVTIYESKSYFDKLNFFFFRILFSFVKILFTVVFFFISSVPLISISSGLQNLIPLFSVSIYQELINNGIVVTSGYGLFRSMTGVGEILSG